MLEVDPYRVAQGGMAVGGARGFVDTRRGGDYLGKTGRGELGDEGLGHATRVP